MLVDPFLEYLRLRLSQFNTFIKQVSIQIRTGFIFGYYMVYSLFFCSFGFKGHLLGLVV